MKHFEALGETLGSSLGEGLGNFLGDPLDNYLSKTLCAYCKPKSICKSVRNTYNLFVILSVILTLCL